MLRCTLGKLTWPPESTPRSGRLQFVRSDVMNRRQSAGNGHGGDAESLTSHHIGDGKGGDVQRSVCYEAFYHAFSDGL
jgi:hypothetical protein